MSNLLAENRKARFDYEIIDTLEAGLVLSGQETKSAKSGHINLKGSFVTFQGSNAYLTNANIAAYPFAGALSSYDPTRSRRLLLHKKEIGYLREKTLEQGLTVVPIKVYTKNRFIKIEIAVGRGKHKFDKRETIKQRELNREIKQAK